MRALLAEYDRRLIFTSNIVIHWHFVWNVISSAFFSVGARDITRLQVTVICSAQVDSSMLYG